MKNDVIDIKSVKLTKINLSEYELGVTLGTGMFKV